MSNLPSDSHFISLTQAIAMTMRYRQQKETILATPYQDRGILPVCETFGREAIEALLQEEACAAIRIYGGMDENLLVRFVVVGVNALGEDILPLEQNLSLSGAAVIVEDGIRCPTNCPPTSPLNP